jgi:hypothetical protein
VRGINGNRRPLHAQAAIADRASRRFASRHASPFQQMVRVSLRTVTMLIPSQRIITKDNVSIDIAAVAYYHISDPERAVIAIEKCL